MDEAAEMRLVSAGVDCMECTECDERMLRAEESVDTSCSSSYDRAVADPLSLSLSLSIHSRSRSERREESAPETDDTVEGVEKPERS